VQSVALRLVCEREAAIERFRPAEYWSVAALLRGSSSGREFAARLVQVGGCACACIYLCQGVCTVLP
jgi:DNA topoisomerase-1